MSQVQIAGFFRFESLTAMAASEATWDLNTLGSGASTLQGMGCEDDPSVNSGWLRFLGYGDSGPGWKI